MNELNNIQEDIDKKIISILDHFLNFEDAEDYFDNIESAFHEKSETKLKGLFEPRDYKEIISKLECAEEKLENIIHKVEREKLKITNRIKKLREQKKIYRQQFLYAKPNIKINDATFTFTDINDSKNIIVGDSNAKGGLTIGDS